MKTKLSLTFLVSCFFCLVSLKAQIPQGFNYQAVARDGSGNILQNTSLQVMFYIQSQQTGGTLFWKEWHSSVTTNNFGLFNLVVGAGARQTESTVATFDLIDWSVTSKYIKTEIYYSGGWHELGTSKLLTVPYAMVAEDLAGSVKKLSVKGETSGLEEALFEVKNKDGQTIFAVYNEGVRIYVSDGAKAVKGGFAVGGFGTDKAESTKYLFVGKDSVRIYLDTNPLTKGVKSGFAVGGYDLTKGTVQDYLNINTDSIRIYIDNTPSTKKLKGGFAVGGYDMTKGSRTDYLNVAADETGIINPAQNRILWYPLKNAFLTGRVLITSPTNVGVNSFASGYESRAKGSESQAMGFKATADGNYSTAIGKNANASSINSFAFGDSPQATGNDSYALGAGARAQGIGSYAFGSAGRDASGNLTGGMTTSSGNYSFSIGQGSLSSGILSMTIGTSVTASGTWATAMGFGSIASGTGAFSYGSLALCSDLSFSPTVAAGDFSVAIGQSVTAKSYCMVALGRFNQDFNGSLTNSIQTDQLFVIGNGGSCTNRKNAMTILKNGMIGLQTVTSPTYALHLPNSTTPGVGQALANSWVTYSDARIKSNLDEINYGLKEILQLQPKQYIQHNSDNYINNPEDDSGVKSLGLIAQEVYKIMPEVVSKPNSEDQLWGVDYNKIIPVLVKGMQEQQQQIESYKSENENLKTQLEVLQEKVDKIEDLLSKALDE